MCILSHLYFNGSVRGRCYILEYLYGALIRRTDTYIYSVYVMCRHELVLSHGLVVNGLQINISSL